MKKMLIFIVSFALFCTLGGSVLADSEYANAMALYNSWYVEKDVDGQKVFEQEYPEAVCGVWSTDGGMDNLTVAVTDDEAGERAKEGPDLSADLPVHFCSCHFIDGKQAWREERIQSYH